MKLSECIAPFPFLCSCRKFQAVTLSLFPYRAYSLTVSKLLVVPSAITTHWGAETHCQPVYHVVADKATTVKKGFRARVTSHDAGMHGLIYWFDGKKLTTIYRRSYLHTCMLRSASFGRAPSAMTFIGRERQSTKTRGSKKALNGKVAHRVLLCSAHNDAYSSLMKQ